jgi:phage terminase large subunit-like protein
MTRVSARDVIRFIETHCFVPEGRFVGQPIRLVGFQRDFVEAIYDNPRGPTRRGFLSMGRKNGKTSLRACLLLNHLCGPSARDRPNSQLYSIARSRDQAGLIFSACSKMIRLNPELAGAVRIQETAKALVCAELGVTYRALSAETSTAMGLSPQLCICDELGQVKGARSSLYEAMESGTSALESPLSLTVSTQASADGDLLSMLLDDAIAGYDPQTVVRLYTAPTELDPFGEEALRAANPAYDAFMNKDELRAMAEIARRMPAREMEYRNLILNQRVELFSPFLSRDVWQACDAEPGDLRGCDVYGGLDLSSTNDLTCLVLAGCDPMTGVWSVVPYFWLPAEGLAEKSRSDRVPLDLWAERKFIELCPGRSVSYEYVSQRLRELVDEYQVKRIAFDAWGMKHLRPWLGKAGFSEATIEERFVAFGQGYKSMSPALRDLESLVLDRRLKHGGHPVLTWNCANAVIESDAAGNRKLSKKRASGRIDGMVSLVMAVSVSPTPPSIDISTLIA